MTALLAAGCTPQASEPASSIPSVGSAPATVTQSQPAGPVETAPAASGTRPDSGLADELIAPGALVVCTEFPVPRFAELDSSGEPRGASVDLAVEIGRRIGLAVEHRDTVFEDIIPDIEGGDCDLGLAGHIITPEREARITMVPYLRGQQELTVRTGNPEGFDDLTDLCGETVLTRAGSLQEQLVIGTGPYLDDGLNDRCEEAGEDPIDLRTYAGEAEAIEDFLDGQGAAFLGSSVWVAEHPDELEEAATVVLPGYTNGIGINRDDRELAQAVRAALGDMIDDGTYLEILTEWGVGQPLE